MAKVRPTSASLVGFGVGWTVIPGDEVIARNVVTFLEDRRVLFHDRHSEGERYCVYSALQCRTFLTEQIAQTTAGQPLEATLQAMRAAFREFVERGGPEGSDFEHHRPYGVDEFSMALGEVRRSVGEGVARLGWRYDLDIDDELAQILPPEDNDEDPSWLIGFDRQ